MGYRVNGVCESTQGTNNWFYDNCTWIVSAVVLVALNIFTIYRCFANATNASNKQKTINQLRQNLNESEEMNEEMNKKMKKVEELSLKDKNEKQQFMKGVFLFSHVSLTNFKSYFYLYELICDVVSQNKPDLFLMEQEGFIPLARLIREYRLVKQKKQADNTVVEHVKKNIMFLLNV